MRTRDDVELSWGLRPQCAYLGPRLSDAVFRTCERRSSAMLLSCGPWCVSLFLSSTCTVELCLCAMMVCDSLSCVLSRTVSPKLDRVPRPGYRLHQSPRLSLRALLLPLMCLTIHKHLMFYFGICWHLSLSVQERITVTVSYFEMTIYLIRWTFSSIVWTCIVMRSLAFVCVSLFHGYVWILCVKRGSSSLLWWAASWILSKLEYGTDIRLKGFIQMTAAAVVNLYNHICTDKWKTAKNPCPDDRKDCFNGWSPLIISQF